MEDILLEQQRSSHKLVLHSNLEDKIRFLCSKIPATEWSGVLFYTYKGDFATNDLQINAVDLLLMDIGDSTSTMFNTSTPDIVGYMAEKDLLNCNIGLIHSHHTMSTFFSSTDLNTLKVEGSERNVFLSLIVNNAGTYTAAITRKVVSTVYKENLYTSFNDKTTTGNEKHQRTVVEYYMLNIVKPLGKEFNDIQDSINNLYKRKQQRQTSLFDDNFDSSTLFEHAEQYFDTSVKNQSVTPADIVLKLITGNACATEDDIDLQEAVDTVSWYGPSFPEEDDFIDFAIEYCDLILRTFQYTDKKEKVLKVLKDCKDSAGEDFYLNCYIDLLSDE